MAPQDTYIEEEDELCPLCIEEFDLQDRFFKPCPCGYQICQFCFNNIRNNVNGLCPACRRPYDEKTIEWRTPSAEEIAEYEARKQQNNKKRLVDQRQKETQKRDTEKDSRKNLVGVRVVQKNLVYVTGLTPTVREDELLKTLRKPEFFGQYGNIQKISISNRKSTDGHNQSLGIYVTFEKKEDAARCIQAVNGSQNGDRILRAQLGTTKYCSAWLRHEQCNNRQCMFLHELGDEEDSYSRQDLSSMNTLNSQRPPANSGSSRSASRQQVHAPSSQHSAQPMVRSSSKDGSENDDGPALPSTANWARNPQVRSRRGSLATSGAAPSPAISNSLPTTAESVQEAVEVATAQEATAGPPAESAAFQEPAVVSQSEPVEQDPARGILRTILKTINSCPTGLPAVFQDPSEDDLHPPLFDIRGGEKRRALREEDDTRLGVEQEDEAIEAPEPTDDEHGRSGSLALGGEPEDRAQGRDNHGFDPRRGPQPPIQRGSNDTLFGQAIGSSFGQNSTSIGSIGSRTMTPQQHGLMRPQSGFGDNLPPGLSSQANLFQGQGHVRQTSRFNFSNDTRDATSTNVKLTANPRIMAQQSTMMPSNFYNPSGGQQFHGSSMPGPPPGINSTGTPPNMFGQHGFGSTFGAMAKENELLSMLRPRAGGSQTHDAGKREYMFSTLPNQYPPSASSTPAPAANLIATLYGSQPGAFQDFGSKQKKKGKKHRHANTSSSGGSGLVDLADPSIIQARVPHQQQSSAGVGQGLYGGQSQEDELPSLDEATSQVDALVADDPIDTIRAPPPGVFDPFTGPVTLAIPPGLFPSISVHASPAASHASLHAGSKGQQTPVVLPILPLKEPVSAGASSATPTKKVSAPPPGEDAKKNIKALAIESGLSKDIASQSSKVKSQKEKVLQEEDFPALDSPKPALAVRATTPVPAKPAKNSASSTEKAAEKERSAAKSAGKQEKAAEKAASKSPEKSSTKAVVDAAASATIKQPRETGKKGIPILNIAAATKVALSSKQSEATSSAANDKPIADKDAFPALPTPGTTSVSSPFSRTAPKTLRVVPTPKTEIPPTPSGLSHGALRTAAAAIAGRPGTPANEVASDSASIISASISASRTSSPPPSKVGSAPIRNTTKSQQRKQRKEATKREVAVIAPQAEPEVDIAPIVGRKKKQKKEKEKDKERVVSMGATPTASRPETPIAQPAAMAITAKEVKEVKEVKEESSTYRSTANETTNVLDDKTSPKIDMRGKSMEGCATVGEATFSSTPKVPPSPYSVFQELLSGNLIPPADELALLKPVNSQADKFRPETASALLKESLISHELLSRETMLSTKPIVTAEEQQELIAGKSVRKTVDGVRILLTPNFDCVRNLTEEEEDRFLEFQKRVWESIDDPAMFTSARHDSAGGFSLISRRAVPNGPPSYFPQLAAMMGEPLNKIQREEAIYYINQYVLPRLNLGTNPVGGVSPGAWKSAFPDGKLNVQANATSLNSIAPWIYGNGHGPSPAPHDSTDTAAPELNYPGPMGSFADPTIFDLPGPSGPVRVSASLDTLSAASLDAALPTPLPNLSVNAPAAGFSAHAGKPLTRAAGTTTTPGPFGSVPLMSIEDAGTAMSLARKEAESYEKKLNQMIKKNRRILLGTH